MSVLPPYQWNLLAAGNANVVFSSPDTDQLLRLRRNKNAPGTAEIDEYLATSIRPVLGRFLFSYSVVALPLGFVASLPQADELDQNEPLGLLMENLGPKPEQTLSVKSQGVKIVHDSPWNSYTVEVKPKWLIQSPTAPNDSTNCRTCALGLLRGKPKMCPLKLFNKDTDIVEDTLNRGFPGKETQLKPLAKFFSSSSLFDDIRLMQEGDEKGILGYAEYSHLPQKFVTAMAMRDVSLFVSVEGQSVSGKVVDADIKSVSEKRDYWSGLEEQLISGGYYQKGQSDCLLQNS